MIITPDELLTHFHDALVIPGSARCNVRPLAIEVRRGPHQVEPIAALFLEVVDRPARSPSAVTSGCYSSTRSAVTSKKKRA
jgi:hypothetical protein